MRQKFKKIVALFLLFIIGVLIGAGGATLWSTRSLQFIIETITLSYLAYENEEATEQYLHSPNIDSSIYALQHLIKFEEDFYRGKTDLKKISKPVIHDLAVSYVRLGNLYEKKGDNEKANNSFRKALEIVLREDLFKGWKETEKEIKTIDDLKRYVVELDKRLREKRRENKGK